MVFGISLFILSSCGVEAEKSDLILPQRDNVWFSSAQEVLRQNLSHKPIIGKAKNIILFIGDGMGVSTVTAARIFDGQNRGLTGEENILSWENFPNVALSKTYNTNMQVSDSAGTATAFMTGVKSKAGVISVDQSITLGDCASATGHHATSFLELAEQHGMATGIISTARLTHATPATAYAHVPDRYWESDSDMPETEKAAGCKDIALQFVEFSYGDGIEVAFAGGRQNFLPRSVTDPEGGKGKRTDKRNLISEWQQKHNSGQYIWNEQMFDSLDLKKNGPVLGLFNASHMAYEADRSSDKGGEPSLMAMTEKALQILQQKNDGYFLYVEAARIDHAHHNNNAYRALDDTVALAEAVRKAVEMTSREDTLIIVTADHSHVFTMAGYPVRGNPILGKVIGNKRGAISDKGFALALDNMPYTTLGYYSGAGAKINQPRGDLSNVDTKAKDFKQQALVPFISETHGGEDVAIYARGPSAHLIRGVVEENYIFHVMYHAIGGEPQP
ncbi:MAG: alkaline phosphatase [Alphaproteobacteria bacterium]|nr:MAG: alkaline phosphatase [Alphaproteobacteria bacterium]